MKSEIFKKIVTIFWMIIASNQGYAYFNPLLNLFNTNGYDTKVDSSKLGQFYFRTSLPGIAFFGYNNGRGFNNYRAALGLTGGLDYYHSQHSYVSFSGGATGIAAIEVVHKDSLTNDTTQYSYAFSAKLTNNFEVNFFSSKKIRLTLGYGLSFSHFTYLQTVQKIPDANEDFLYGRKQAKLGLALDANMFFTKYFYLGLSIFPSFFTINTQKLESSYLTYFEIGFRYPLTKNKKVKNITRVPRI